MARARTALVALLIDAGVDPAKASHFSRTVDRLRLNSWGSDDLAAILLKWAEAKYRPRLKSPDQSIKYGLPDLDPDQLVLFGPYSATE